MLAREGSRLDSKVSRHRIIVRTPESSSVSLCWKKETVESLTRSFLKEVLNLKTGAEWRATSSVQKIEPEKETATVEWNTLWRKIKSHNGVRCSSLKRNSEAAMLIKCLNEKLPVLKTLVQRRPDIYESPFCVVCNEETEEDQEHLACCKGHEKSWRETENTMINLAWIALSEETRKKTSKTDIKNCIWGISKKENIESRMKIIKGLLQEKV
jgi:hypothetical protein